MIIDKRALQDDRLSWKAKGILAYMLSMPNDWVFYVEELITHSTDGKTSFESGLKELKKLGYVSRVPIRDEKTKKIVKWETVVREEPIPPKSDKQGEESHNPENLGSGKPNDRENESLESQSLKNYSVGEPLMENDSLLSTDVTKNDCTKYDLTNVDDDAPAEKFNLFMEYKSITGKTPNAIQSKLLMEWIAKFPSDVLQEGLKRMQEGTPDNPFNYLKKIMEYWEQKGLFTLQAIYGEDEKFKLNNQKSKGANQHAKSNESAGGQYTAISIRDISL